MISRRVQGNSHGNLPVLIAGIVLLAFLGFIVFVTMVAQRDFRQSHAVQAQNDLDVRASALSYFFHERKKDLWNISEDVAIAAFFANEALGMSMEYGLGASLARLERRLDEWQQSMLPDGYPAFSRLVFLREDGGVLADTQRDGEPCQLDAHLHFESSGDPLIHARGREIFLSLRYLHAAQPVGSLVARVNLEGAFKRLVHDGREGGATRIMLIGHEGVVLHGGSEHHGDPWSGVAQDEDPRFASAALGGTGPLRIQAPVSGTPFVLVGVHDPEGLAGYLTSHWAVVLLLLLSGMVVVVMVFANRLQAQALLLRGRVDESTRQGRILERQNEQLVEEIEKRKVYERCLAVQANFDDLTGLPNRNLAMDRVSQALRQQQRRYGNNVAIMLLDLDSFKKVNDSLGHGAGDHLLARVGSRIKAALRESDTVARLGGDEFLVLLPEVKEAAVIEAVCTKLVNVVRRPIEISGHEFRVSASLGVTVAPADGLEAEGLMRNADIALYRAKEEGKACYRFFTREMDEKLKRRQAMEDALIEALDRGEFYVVYQPIVRVCDGAIVGAEALLRWHNPALGDIPPARFVPLCEDLGIIGEIGAWLLGEACTMAATWNRSITFDLAVNISSLQLRDPEHFLGIVRTAVGRSGLPASALNLEITESVLLEDSDTMWKMLEQLDRLGVRLSIDDFGTGYSSLSYLRKLPFDTLKIDRTFVRDLPADPGAVALAKAILSLARAMHMETIAEGIENAGQLNFFREQQCELAQGYLFYRPMTAEALGALVLDSQSRSKAVGEPVVPLK